jgi:hypothetical protein
MDRLPCTASAHSETDEQHLALLKKLVSRGGFASTFLEPFACIEISVPAFLGLFGRGGPLASCAGRQLPSVLRASRTARARRTDLGRRLLCGVSGLHPRRPELRTCPRPTTPCQCRQGRTDNVYPPTGQGAIERVQCITPESTKLAAPSRHHHLHEIKQVVYLYYLCTTCFSGCALIVRGLRLMTKSQPAGGSAFSRWLLATRRRG